MPSPAWKHLEPKHADNLLAPDSSLINVSQQIPRWKEYLPEVDEKADANSESWLGLLVNMMNIGSIVSFFIT